MRIICFWTVKQFYRSYQARQHDAKICCEVSKLIFHQRIICFEDEKRIIHSANSLAEPFNVESMIPVLADSEDLTLWPIDGEMVRRKVHRTQQDPRRSDH
jgi:hypothetical protein